MLVVGVTCTLSSRSFFFLSVRLVYVPAKFNVSISFAVAFLQPFEPRRPFLSIGYRSSSSSSLSMSPRYRHCLFIVSPPDPCSHPFSGFMAPLWILDLISLVSVFIICSVLSSCSGATWFSLSITVYSYLSISFFAFDIRCPCSPTCFFVPSSLGLFYRRSPLHLSYPSTSIKIRLPLSIAAPTVLQSL